MQQELAQTQSTKLEWAVKANRKRKHGNKTEAKKKKHFRQSNTISQLKVKRAKLAKTSVKAGGKNEKQFSTCFSVQLISIIYAAFCHFGLPS